MMHFSEPNYLLCLTCGSLNARSEPQPSLCHECEAPIDTERLLRLYEYAAQVYYYGRQYRIYYERAYESDSNPAKPSLQFAGEAFAWVMLAVLSGVLGNASYDAIKLVIAKLADGVAAGKLPSRDYTPLLELTDDKLGELVDAAQTYCGGMEGLTREVRTAIVEEIMADVAAYDPLVAEEMVKLMQRKTIKPKHRKRFAALLRNAIAGLRNRTKPLPGAFTGLWSRLTK